MAQCAWVGRVWTLSKDLQLIFKRLSLTYIFDAVKMNLKNEYNDNCLARVVVDETVYDKEKKKREWKMSRR